MATIDTFHLPKDYTATIAVDSNGTGHLVRLDGSNTPSEFRTLSASTSYTIGPFNEDRQYRTTMTGGSYTLDKSYKGTENSDQSTDVDVSTEDATYTIDYNDGVYHKLTFTENCVLEFKFPVGKINSMVLELIDAGGVTITLPAALEHPGGTPPTFTASGKDLVTVMTDKNGVQTMLVMGLDLQAV